MIDPVVSIRIEPESKLVRVQFNDDTGLHRTILLPAR
jgi:hypothetical protein